MLVLVIKNKLKRAARNWPQKMQFLTLLLERKTLYPSQEGGERAGVVHFKICCCWGWATGLGRLGGWMGGWFRGCCCGLGGNAPRKAVAAAFSCCSWRRWRLAVVMVGLCFDSRAVVLLRRLLQLLCSINGSCSLKR